jgi:hypothetical protein
MGAAGERKKVFFFEKKNQKTFVCWCASGRVALARDIKVFCFLSSEPPA